MHHFHPPKDKLQISLSTFSPPPWAPAIRLRQMRVRPSAILSEETLQARQLPDLRRNERDLHSLRKLASFLPECQVEYPSLFSCLKALSKLEPDPELADVRTTNLETRPLFLLSARHSGLSLAKDTAAGTFAGTSQHYATCQPTVGFSRDTGGAGRGLAVPPQQCSGTTHCMTQYGTAQAEFRSCLDSDPPLMETKVRSEHRAQPRCETRV